ncbi:hypothetical protein KI387_016209 [Taxus chinensis]|uniref:Uncharacterized protein n=1 Tax=Taxus chinensis TaxID=29808 RepID=A0AA38GHS2_TAXCH|nr:hypothetical protein KI387_016209 [Taxus chinensis]
MIRKKLVKKISEVDCSSPSLQSDSVVIDDVLESDLISSEMNEPELFDLALPSGELLPDKWITTPIYISQQSEGSIAGEFHSFNGSRFSPIQEASLILNTTIANVSKNPFTNSSQWKRNIVGPVSSMTRKKLVKKISEVDCSSPSLQSDSVVIDDVLESDLISSEMNEPELFDLALPFGELLPDKWITTPIYISQQSEGSIAGEFHSFNGSCFSSIQEASLILNTTIADVFSKT